MSDLDKARKAMDETIKRWEEANPAPVNNGGHDTHDVDDEFERLMKQFKDYLCRDFFDRNKKYFK